MPSAQAFTTIMLCTPSALNSHLATGHGGYSAFRSLDSRDN